MDNMFDERLVKLFLSVDIFVFGCMFVELYMDGKVLFDLLDALAYRRGEYDSFEMILIGVSDDLVCGMIVFMVVLDLS